MIQELKIKNFLSFKEEVTFSFEATKDTFAEDMQVVEVAKGVRLLRFAMVCGANASGKSNLLKAFDFLHDFWFYKPVDVDKKTGVVSFKLDRITPNEPSTFELIFYVDSTKYWYQLELDEKQVYFEKLSYYKSVQPTMLFERELKDAQSIIMFNPAAVKISSVAKEKIAVECLKNMSFFAAKDRVNITIPNIDVAKDWLKNQIMPIVEPRIIMFQYAEKQMLKDKDIKSYLLDFVREADFNIVDVNTQTEIEEMPQEVIDSFLNSNTVAEQEKEKIRKDPFFTTLKTDFNHKVQNERGEETYNLPEELQSGGTKRIFGLEAVIYKTLQKEGFLSIDEIETSLHPQLLKFILLHFLRKKSRSQLLISTHYDPLLDEIGEIIRKDSVWFTEKTESGHTEVYSLIDFKGLNRLSSIQKAYNYRKFGAFPNIDL
ncbi:MAG: ATP-binding protein [Bacteroidales bacterium]|jgi:AAA15 family ATPase/GTPase|nr:ATP-binding protein [Bacteroidales bacterium]MDD2686951.1 ATP-binding protein [Bacteroidales bacterium]MDD3692087.1 ATP-binding protein [Bacteroidales bacterium]MDD3939775.1 ATP-binding protein [Patescibacteria group bacterium]